MEKTQEILKHMYELYSDDENPERLVEVFCRKTPEKYVAWDEAFKEYDLADVLDAIDQFWRFTSNKSQPTVAKLLAMLKTNKAQVNMPTKEYSPVTCPESEYMRRDIELGRNVGFLLSDYRRAIDYIINDMLAERIGGFEYAKIRNDYQTKYSLAMRNGLFDSIDEILRRVKC
jgi:hypothetical protein